MAGVVAQDAVVCARGALAIRQMLRVDARQAHARRHALARPFTAISDALEHTRQLFPAAALTVNVLQQAAGAHVGRIQAHGLFQPFHRWFQITADGVEAQLELRGAHQHRALVNVVGRSLDLGQVALVQLGHAPATPVALVDGSHRARILRTQLEQAQVHDASTIVVVQLLAEHLGLRSEQLRLAISVARSGRGDLE
ncbi:MAG: hypothetical protein QM756_44900 [Polyangiaceae bacterium]